MFKILLDADLIHEFHCKLKYKHLLLQIVLEQIFFSKQHV